MKKLKQVLPILSLISCATLILLGSSFKSKSMPRMKKLVSYYYVMTSGDPTNASDRVNPSNYTRQTASQSCPSGEAELCQIFAEDNGSAKPVITGTLQTALNNGGADAPEALSGAIWLKAN